MPRALHELLTVALILVGVTGACAAFACTQPAPARVAVDVTVAADAAREPTPARPATVEVVSAPTGCIDVDGDPSAAHVTLEGRVVVDPLFEHPTHGKTHPYILRLDAARCAKGAGESPVREIALAPSSDVTLKPLVGRHVKVSGDPFSAHTAWHARPVVLWTTTAVAVP